MTTYHQQAIPCPCCDLQVEVNVLTSTNTFGGKSTDLQTFAVGFPPLLIVINTCPNCGYSGFFRDFTEPDIVTDEIRQWVLNEFQPIVQAYGTNPAQGYAFTAQIAELRGASPLSLADLYLRAAWCCAHDGQHDAEIAYRKHAIEYFLQAFEENVIPPQQTPILTYLVGEIYRRIGEIEAATQWFNRVIEQAATDEAWKEIEWLAVQQRDNPKDRL